MANPRRTLALLWLLCLAGLARLAAEGGEPPLGRVRLQLKWYHQFQFAGYYMAQELGYYAEEGLEVELIEASSSTKVNDEVAAGRAEYGINATDILVERAAGRPFVALAVIFQHSPLIVLSTRAGIATPSGLVGRSLQASPAAETEVMAMLRNESIAAERVRILPHSWRLEDLIEGKVDAITAYSTNETLKLAERGIPFTMMRPLTYGIDFYGDCLFTTEKEIREQPGRAAAMRRASLKGWEYAMAHVDEACELILGTYSRAKSLDQLRAEAEAMDELIVHRFIPLGFMNPGRWRHIADTYASLGVMPPDFDLGGFIYEPEGPGPDLGRLRAIGLAAGLLAALALVASLILFAFNRRLTILVGQRTRSLEEANSALGREIVERKDKEAALAASLAEKEVLLREVHHRVKNNLQIIMSLIGMELDREVECLGADALLAIRNRIYGMALVHENLYRREGTASIDMDEYLDSLAGEILRSLGPPGLVVESAIEAGGLHFLPETAIPLGLIAGELFANSLKHAFKGRIRGRVSLRLSLAGDTCVLGYADDGPGRRDGDRHPGGIGLVLVEALAAQLQGRLEYGQGPGFHATITFPLPSGGAMNPPITGSTI